MASQVSSSKATASSAKTSKPRVNRPVAIPCLVQPDKFKAKNDAGKVCVSGKVRESSKKSGEGSGSEKVFKEFCEGKEDRVLKYTDEEDRGRTSCNAQLNSENIAIFQNSYQLTPKTVFRPDQGKAIIRSVLEDNLNDKEYNYQYLSNFAVQLSQKIKDKLKAEMHLPRYKLVASVTIAEKCRTTQGMRVGSRCNWNSDTDNYAEYTYISRSMYVTGQIYAVYYE